MAEFCFLTSGAPGVIWCVCGTLADFKQESMTATIHTTLVFKSIVLTCSQNNTIPDSLYVQIPEPKVTLYFRRGLFNAIYYMVLMKIISRSRVISRVLVSHFTNILHCD